uniref:glycoside hydrolase family 108 protein n=1 Tax=Aerococcus urinaeequi TaxID=51665 RepID=UPI00352B7844
MRFDDAFKIVLGFEGGYSNDPADRGGETNYGITYNTLNDAKNKGWIPFNVTIQNIQLEHAKIIYRKGYWDAVQADSLPHPLDLIMFDSAVNHGPGAAVKLLQKSLNALLRYTELKIDGIVGPLTLRAVNDYIGLGSTPGTPPDSNIRYLCIDVLLNRVELYSSIVNSNRSQEKFLRGWLNRVFKLKSQAGL